MQGKTVNGAGINASFAIEQDATGTCVDKTLGWAVGNEKTNKEICEWGAQTRSGEPADSPRPRL